jgi:hypothetical protein
MRRLTCSTDLAAATGLKAAIARDHRLVERFTLMANDVWLAKPWSSEITADGFIFAQP